MHDPSAIDKQAANDASQDTAASRQLLTTEFQNWNEKGIQSIIEKGRIIQRGKDELSDEEWTAWVVDDLRLKPYAANLYVLISRNPILSDEKNWKHLPADYRTLYELSLTKDDKLREYITQGGVHHDLKRDAAGKLKKQSMDKPKPKKDPMPMPKIPDHLQLLQNVLLYFRQAKEWRAYMHHTPRPDELPSKEDIEAAVQYVEKKRLQMRGTP
jgi:hypothetical protein